MAKAIYSTSSTGHYGLGFSYYSHFTSPIRRYPDLIVHRLLSNYINNQTASFNVDDLLCSHCSEKERLASIAERDSIKYMQVKFLEKKVGSVFTGLISGVTNWGFYVELIENGCEGLVKVSSLKGGFFYYDEKQFALIGSEKTYQLGQTVKIKVIQADLIKKQLDFILV